MWVQLLIQHKNLLKKAGTDLDLIDGPISPKSVQEILSKFKQILLDLDSNKIKDSSYSSFHKILCPATDRDYLNINLPFSFQKVISQFRTSGNIF